MSKKTKELEMIRNLSIDEGLQELEEMEQKEKSLLEQKKEERHKYILLVSALVISCLVCFIFCTYLNYLESVAKTETVNIMSADYLDTDLHTSSVFTLSEVSSANRTYYEFYEEQKDGSYKPCYVLKDSTSIIKDLEEGQQPYITRDITHNGGYKNIVLHLPGKTKVVKNKD